MMSSTLVERPASVAATSLTATTPTAASLTGSVQQPSGMPVHRYKPFDGPDLPDRRWPARKLRKAPLWCSVDLRDGNQALPEPMDLARKHRLFRQLVAMGFKEIEVGFPSASQVDFDFVRELIEQDLIPHDVTIQVIMQARTELIERTFEALRGARRAVAHLYNSVSPLQRRVVFGADREDILDMTVQAVRLITKLAAEHVGGEILFEYSPESFTATEPDFALEICEAVMDVWQPAPGRPIIISLPATVECTLPNEFADQVEWMDRNLSRREHITLCVHPHNDRGTGVAAAELAVLAGADRVEGCLFGNGERTGNVDLVTLGMNLFSQGVDPMIDFSDMATIRQVAEECTQLPTHPRHPYAGDLVYTAFSGSHQDAIKKGLDSMERAAQSVGILVGETPWGVPYLPIDPKDIGRSYEAIIRVNSQSGKGGVAYLLKTGHGFDLPRRLQVEVSRMVQRHSEECATEVGSAQVWELFTREFLAEGLRLRVSDTANGVVEAELDGSTRYFRADGGEAFAEALRGAGTDVVAQSLTVQPPGAENSSVVVYAECTVDGESVWGVGLHSDEAGAAVRAIASAVNRAAR
ncbi:MULTISPECIES: 2-isopropylmalate synthase [unclassified Streptomyces]|uniref:2-isopropylmalate synthase n=1 Tax=unclassified Streptomyces TaxID=2593676 RepID=UPI00364D9958